MNDTELRAHLTEHHPVVQLTDVERPHGIPITALAYAHDTEHADYICDHEHAEAGTEPTEFELDQAEAAGIDRDAAREALKDKASSKQNDEGLPEWADRSDDGLSNAEILKQLEDYAKLDIIQYVLPTTELGREWVIGLEGLGICKLRGKAQAIAFITGANAMVARFAKQQGF